jgi:HEAT repeat protein
MKSSSKAMLLQGGILALLLLVLIYLAWQRYHQPALRTYEGKALEQLIEDLDDPDYHVSERAAGVLADAGREGMPFLLDACEQGGIRLHRRAAAVLVRQGATAAPGLVSALKNKAQQQRVEVILVRLGPAAVPFLREALTEEVAGEAAAHILGLIGPRAADAVPDLIAALKRREAPTALRSRAAFALGRIGEPSDVLVPPLIAALSDSKKEVRERGVEALGRIGSPARDAVPALAAALKDEEATVATKACQALSFIGESKVAQPLLAAFQSGRSEVAVEAGRALWRLGQQADPIVPALLTLAEGPIEKSAPARNLLASFGPHIVPMLVEALRDSDAAKREAAVDVLGRIGPPARTAILPVLAALKDKSPAVALMAAMAVAQIDATRGGAAVKLLTNSLDLPGASIALADLGHTARAAVPELIAALKPRKEIAHDELIRLHVQLALARIGTAAVPALIAALKDKREGVAPLAAGALGWVLPPPKEAVAALRAALKNDRAHAAVYADALGQLGSLALPAVPDLTNLLTDAASRTEAAVALVRIDPHQAAKIVPMLIKDLQAEDEKQRQAAVVAVTRLGPAAQSAADALTALLRDRLLTELEIIALHEVWPGAIPGLINLLKAPDVDCRKRALFALGQIGPAARSAIKPLIAALSDRDSDVRAGAAHVLEQIGPDAAEAVPALIANLQASDAAVRSSAAVALGTIGPAAEEARRPLLECLLDPEERVRYAAALSLGRIDPHFAEAVPGLRNALNDPSPEVQLAAIDSLSHIDHASRKYTIPILVSLCAKPEDLQVRFRAVEGLCELSPEQSKQAVPWLLVQLNVVDPQLNFLYAARVLARIDPRHAPMIVLSLAAALHPPDLMGSRRRAILRTLAEFGPKAHEVVPEIERMLYDGTPGVRSEAIRTLRAVNPARVKQLCLD